MVPSTRLDPGGRDGSLRPAAQRLPGLLREWRIRRPGRPRPAVANPDRAHVRPRGRSGDIGPAHRNPGRSGQLPREAFIVYNIRTRLRQGTPRPVPEPGRPRLRSGYRYRHAARKGGAIPAACGLQDTGSLRRPGATVRRRSEPVLPGLVRGPGSVRQPDVARSRQRAWWSIAGNHVGVGYMQSYRVRPGHGTRRQPGGAAPLHGETGT